MSEILTTSVIKILKADLETLKNELNAYKSEDSIWKVSGEIKNSSGNLCLHLCGNLRYYIGKILGNSGYLRNREAEFSTKNIGRSELLNQIEDTIASIESTLPKLPGDVINQNYPTDVFGYPMTTGYFLIYLTSHLKYHLGQINYHRRLLDT